MQKILFPLSGLLLYFIAYNWWLRSPNVNISNGSNNFLNVNTNGSNNNNNANNSNGVVVDSVV